MSGIGVGARIGAYRLIGEIGNGGLGAVYRAVEEGSGREAVVRVFAREVSGDAVLADRLRTMAPALRRLHHAHIGGVYELVTAGADLALLLEHVPGTPLDRVKRDAGALDSRASVACAVQVLRALEYAHGRGILHHALRPTNLVMVPGGAIKVMDFGIGHALGAIRKVPEDRLLSVLAYLAPEQIQNDPGDARSDLYAVGVMLYEWLTGRRPFDHRTESALRQAHLNEPPASPRFLVPELPEWLDQAVLRSLAKHPAARYQTATEFRAVLEAAPGLAAPREAAAERSHAGPPSATVGAAPQRPGPQASPARAPAPHPAVPVEVQPTAQGTGVSRAGAYRLAGPTPALAGSPSARVSSGEWAQATPSGAHRAQEQVPLPFRAGAPGRAEAPRGEGAGNAPARLGTGVVAALIVALGVAAAGAYCWKRGALLEMLPAARPAALSGEGRTGTAPGRQTGTASAPSPDPTFRGVKYLARTDDGPREFGAILVFASDRLRVTPEGGGAALRSVRYRDIAAASCSRIERKRLGLLSSTRLVLAVETAGEPLLLRIDEDHAEAILEALEARWGKAVGR